MVLGGSPATCTTVTTSTGTTTACGTPPAMKLYCNNKTTPPDTLQLRALQAATAGVYGMTSASFLSLSTVNVSQFMFPGPFGFTPSGVAPPVIVPTNPGLLFIPPPTLSTSTPTSTTSNGPNAVDCQVRTRPHPRVGHVGATPAGANGADVAAGDALVFQIGGLAARSPVSLYLNTGTTPIGTLSADEVGYLAGWIRVPSGTPVGANTFQMAGVLDGNRSVSMITGFTVHAPRPLTIAASAPLSAGTTKLSTTSIRALHALLTRVPATVPNTCHVASYFTQSSRTAVLAQTRQALTFLKANGLTCKVGYTWGSTNIAKIAVHTSR